MLAFFAMGCKKNHTAHIDEIAVPNVVLADTAYIAIIKDNKGNKPVSLNSSELKRTDSLLRQSVADYNNGEAQERYYEFKEENPGIKRPLEDFTINLQHYKRQYVATINKEGKKEVWVNCFCPSLKDGSWKTKVISVSDGGKCFFSVTVNLSENEYSDFYVNGEA